MSAERTRFSAQAAIYAHDLVAAAAAMLVTLVVRYEFEPKATPWPSIWTATAVFAAVCAAVFPLFRLPKGLWRYTALNDVFRIVRASIAAVLVFLPILFLINRGQDFPRATPFLVLPVLVGLLCAGRVAARLAYSRDPRAVLEFHGRGRAAVVVVGAAQDAADFLAGVRGEVRRRLAGIIALDGGPRAGRTIRGVEVKGTLDNLAALLKALGAKEDKPPQVVLATPRPDRALLDAVIRAAGEAGATVVRARAAGAVGSPSLIPVQAADLLDRPPRALDPALAGGLIAGKRVLVTGGGGAIGSELVRQVVRLNPERLILLDASEFNLYALDQELRETGVTTPWTAELGDVRDIERLKELFARERPQVVLHAAALKHVPLMELNPAEATLTNVGGALNVARLARDQAEAFVFISTDKAVNPTNVMGATKRVAERVVQALFAGSGASASIVRFGNVLGSTGSVIPLFERQIAQGGPITLTHPDMVRYFMTVQEAAALVLQAAALPGEPDRAHVYVLDMGEQVRIESLARQLIRLHGLRPDRDIQLVHTGVRPGEKLSEEIFYAAEDVQPTSVDGVMAARAAEAPWAEIEGPVTALLAAAARRDRPAVIAGLKALEGAFEPG